VARAALARVIGVDNQERGAGVALHTGTRPALRTAAGAFVTIHTGKDLRGCIGYPESDLPLAEVVRRCAVAAATSDRRFPVLNASEWPRVSIEISVLGPIEPVADISEMEMGRHGLIAQLGHLRGVLLPQVAAERGWGREEFADHTCRKAGLPTGAWRSGAKLFKFEAQVFSSPLT
jgi:AmmeMemoRadiSam system protein A